MNREYSNKLIPSNYLLFCRLSQVIALHGQHLKASAAMVRLRLYDILALLRPGTYEGTFLLYCNTGASWYFSMQKLVCKLSKTCIRILTKSWKSVVPNCSDTKEFFSFIVVHNFRQFQLSLARTGCGIFTNGQCSEHNYVISAISLQPRRWCIARLMVKGLSKLTIKFSSLL